MCGISGIFDLKGSRALDEGRVCRMRDALRHRGPDEEGVFLAEGVGLGHRRLSIIDLSTGQQPMQAWDVPVTLVYNGEIFNFGDVKAELTSKGHKFHTHSDTEVVLRSWIEWREACVDRFRGMFAFAIYDARDDVLFLARDRLGVKPFYYAVTRDGYLVFASELKAILCGNDIDLAWDSEAIQDYFTLGYVPDPKSIYRSVRKLAAGHVMSVKRGGDLAPRQYWDVPFEPTTSTDEQIEEQFLERLSEAVRIRLMSEVPLGAFLSGGIDSSTVVALMSRMQAEPVTTCSMGFDDPQFDESSYAETVADLYKTNHHRKVVDPNNLDLLDVIPGVYDEPFADSSALPTLQVCQLAREHVTVALSGDGADELMSGYSHHRSHLREQAVRSALPNAVRRPLFGLLGGLYPKLDWAPKFLRAKSTFQGLASDEIQAYVNTVSPLSEDVRGRLFSAQFEAEIGGYKTEEHFRDVAKAAPSKDSQSLIQYLDAKIYLPGDILTKVDRASMAHSLEVRSPFMDHEWIEWVSGLPNRFKFDGTNGKAALKRQAKSLLPAELLTRRKQGFGVPLAAWFGGPLASAAEKLVDERGPLLQSGLFDDHFLKTAVAAHKDGRSDYGALLWSLLMFEGFLKSETAGVDR